MVTCEQLAIDVDGLLPLAHDTVDDSHVSVVVLVARMATHGLLQQRHDFESIVGGGLFLYLVKGTGKQLLGHRGNDEFARLTCRRGEGRDALPVLVAQLLHLQLFHLLFMKLSEQHQNLQ